MYIVVVNREATLVEQARNLKQTRIFFQLRKYHHRDLKHQQGLLVMMRKKKKRMISMSKNV